MCDCTVSIKRKNPTAHIMGLVTILKTLVAQPIPVKKEMLKVNVDLNQKYIPSTKYRIWTLANYATDLDGLQKEQTMQQHVAMKATHSLKSLK